MAHLMANYLPLVERYQNASIHGESDRPDGDEIAGFAGHSAEITYWTLKSGTSPGPALQLQDARNETGRRELGAHDHRSDAGNNEPHHARSIEFADIVPCPN